MRLIRTEVRVRGNTMFQVSTYKSVYTREFQVANVIVGYKAREVRDGKVMPDLRSTDAHSRCCA